MRELLEGGSEGGGREGVREFLEGGGGEGGSEGKERGKKCKREGGGECR